MHLSLLSLECSLALVRLNHSDAIGNDISPQKQDIIQHSPIALTK
jgi:hypothetical protein